MSYQLYVEKEIPVELFQTYRQFLEGTKVSDGQSEFYQYPKPTFGSLLTALTEYDIPFVLTRTVLLSGNSAEMVTMLHKFARQEHVATIHVQEDQCATIVYRDTVTGINLQEEWENVHNSSAS